MRKKMKEFGDLKRCFCYKFAIVSLKNNAPFMNVITSDDNFNSLLNPKSLTFLKLNPSMILSLVFHGAFILCVFGPGMIKKSQSVSAPQIDVDLMEIEFTTLDQDLSKNLIQKQPIVQKSFPNRLQPEAVKDEMSEKGKKELQNLAEQSPPQSQGHTETTEGSQTEALRMSYDQYLVSYINKFKTYPRIAERLKQQGVVISKIIITKEGQLKDVVINKSSGYSTLDQGTVNLIKSLAPFKPLPDHFKTEYEVRIPIEYILGS